MSIRMHTALALPLAVLACRGTACAADAFHDDFDGPAFHAALEDVDGAYVLDGGQARCLSARSYVRTVASDYNTVDFTMDVTFVIDGGGGPAGVFVGLGPATPDGAYFDEPLHSVYFLDHAGDFGYTPFVVRALPNPGAPQGFFEWPSPDDGRHRVRVIKRGDELTFEADAQYDGATFVPDYRGTLSLSVDLPFLDETNSHLFFGTGASPSAFDSIRVSTSTGAMQFYPDAYAMDVALETAGFVARTVEDFGTLPVPIPEPVEMDDPLDAETDNDLVHPGDIAEGIGFQSNVQGPGTGGPQPRGATGLLALSPDDDRAVVAANLHADSFDVATLPIPLPRPAYGFNLLASSLDGGQVVEVRVFDVDENLIATTHVPIDPANPRTFVGATPINVPGPGGPPRIGRLNVWDPAGGREGVWEAGLYGFPGCPPVDGCVASFDDDFGDGTLDPRFVNIGTCGDVTESGGTLHLDVPPACIGTVFLHLDPERGQICGDYDITVSFTLDRFETPLTFWSRHVSIAALRADTLTSVTTIERYAAGPGGCATIGQTYKAFMYNGDDCGSDRRFVATDDVIGRFRLERSGPWGRAWYWNHEAGDWALIREDIVPDVPVVLAMYAGDYDGGGLEARFDGLSVNATPCAPDVTGDSAVDIADLLAILSAWGPCDCCDADTDGDGLVGVSDLLAVLGGWGPC